MKNEEVTRIAKLAKIELTDEECGLLGRQFDDILDYIKKIDKLDLTGVEPACHPFEVKNVFRDDEPAESLGAAALTRLAPRHRSGMIEVPRIIEK
ncbi:MAG: Asp-tRNA(Asn)/Glu-tRNA(Gln) amidotransferase subunit GatC [Candidatus Omnitrophica bacterium]|nr:Asp-tRNA(Asn)/Glu-tRNA(Gln) amidotransferase subunit GatC [Candidatus Omnitrophota bacterium]